jgi:hypothetical protein
MAAARVWTLCYFWPRASMGITTGHCAVGGHGRHFFDVAGTATTGRQGNKDAPGSSFLPWPSWLCEAVGRERQTRADGVSELASLGRSMSGHSRSKPGEGQLSACGLCYVRSSRTENMPS